jgi:hypothetical protein
MATNEPPQPAEPVSQPPRPAQPPNQPPPPAEPLSGWAIGGMAFAAVTLMMVGFFHAIAGFAAILEDEFYVVGREYVFDLDVTAWGWIHLLLGIVVFFSGAYIFTGALWARIVGITAAVFSAIANFFFLPYYEFWSIVMIAICVWVIWSLTRPIEQEA